MRIEARMTKMMFAARMTVRLLGRGNLARRRMILLKISRADLRDFLDFFGFFTITDLFYHEIGVRWG